MATITGTSNNDVLQGTPEDDVISGLNGQDTISGEGGDDSITGGGGDDVLYGDEGTGTAPGNDATPLNLSINNLVSDSSSGNNNANPGDFSVYSNIAQLDDGTPISARLVLVSTSNPNLNVDLSGGNGFEILLNSGFGSSASMQGETATFRMEFFDPATGQPVALNSTATFNDLDRNSPGDQESVTLDANSFNEFGVASDSVLNVTTAPGSVTAAGTETNNPNDQDSWFSASFDDRTSIEFTLETRSTQSGFSMNGDLIDDVVVEPIEPGNDTIDGGSGQDVIFGQGGDDSLSGGDGDDEVYGGVGQDNISGGAGNDELFGGGDQDTFTGITAGDTIEGGESGVDEDTLDLTGSGPLRVIFDANDPESGVVNFLDANGNVTGQANFSEIENVIPCFTPGTVIATARGEVAVETLRAGDKVFTRDNGMQEIRWAGRRDVTASELALMPHWQPVLVRAGALGPDLPARDMLLSPNHRLLMTGERANLYFGENEVLSAAKHLTDMDGIDGVETASVSYIHLMFDRHEVILSDGAWSESFQPGDYAMRGIGADQRSEILGLFPELDGVGDTGAFSAARKVLKKHEAKLLSN
ncbi:Hint domain-containing protein [Octadecabacter sp. R77987]|uniref:Hint domain-containing protein n=1 Tax=Octadecabacter sp. R77987 TaxID=3093874 RepID=UPI00366BC13B